MDKIYSWLQIPSPKWLSTVLSLLAWIFREVIAEWIFGDFVEWLEGLGANVVIGDFIAQHQTWLVGGSIIIIALLSIYWASIDTKDRWRNKRAWEANDNLCKEFRDLMHTENGKERADIFTRIETERGKLPDTGLDKIIDEFILGVERERARLGMNPYSDISEEFLSLGLKIMRNYINKKYGGRGHGKGND